MQTKENRMVDRSRKNKPSRTPLFACQECGKRFYTVRAAERASFHGCRCGGVDIDLYVESKGGRTQ